MRHASFCGSAAHAVNRRGFLSTLATAGAAAFATDMTGVQVLAHPEIAQELRRNQKRCIMLWLAGGSGTLAFRPSREGVPPVRARSVPSSSR